MKKMKKLTTLLLTVMLLVNSLCVAAFSSNTGENDVADADVQPFAASVKMGDVNNDGRMNVRDVIVLLDAIASKTTGDFTQDQFTAADVDGDDNIAIRDVIIILDAIASKETLQPVPKSDYLIVHSAQWIDPIGENGYAAATVEYMDGVVVENVVIAAIYDYSRGGFKAMMNAGARPEKDDMSGKYNFHNGYVYTTLQYNTNTWMHLYQVFETDAGLYLKRVDNEYSDVVIMKGVSLIENSDVYTDNTTLFVLCQFDARGNYTGIKYIKGYNNAEMASTLFGYNVDVVLNSESGFAQIVYAPYTKEPVYDLGTTAMFVYFSSDTTTYTLASGHSVFGGYNVNGEAVSLNFALDAYGDELTTVKTLSAMTDLFTNTLVYLEVDNNTGLVKTETIEPIFGSGETDAGAYLHLNAGEFMILNSSVLKAGDLALNINSATVVINGDGETSDLESLDSENLCVVYSSANDTVAAIFVTTISGDNVVTYAQALKLILLAVGFEEQAPTGDHWASGYLEKAIEEKLVSNALTEDRLDEQISKNMIAQIASRALKLPESTRTESPFGDVAMDSIYAPYILSLYDAGIISGDENGNYNGTNKISYAEMITIVWRIYNYED